MTVIGFLDVAQDLYWDAALPFTLALHLPSLQFPMIVHLFVAFPDGRLTTRFERRFVRFCYAANVLPWLLLALFWDPHIDWPYIPPDGPGNLLLVDHNPAVSEALNTVVFFVWIGMFVTLAVLLVRRVRRARGPTRRALTPVAVSAAVTVVLFSVATIADAAGAETADGRSGMADQRRVRRDPRRLPRRSAAHPAAPVRGGRSRRRPPQPAHANPGPRRDRRHPARRVARARLLAPGP